MLTKVSLDCIFDKFNDSLPFTVGEIFRHDKHVDDDKHIEQVILQDVRIQYALAHFWVHHRLVIDKIDDDYNSDEGLKYGLSTTIGSIGWHETDDQLNQLLSIFTKVQIIYDVNRNIVAYRVINPLKRAMKIFEQLIESTKVNKYLTYLTLRPIREDIKDQVCFRYEPLDQANDNETPNLINDEFIRYILNCNDPLIARKKIAIPGFSLEEIENDPVIYAFSKIAGPLYIYVLENTMDHMTSYIKYITW